MLDVIRETANLIEKFRGLADKAFEVKSPTTRDYNCVAFAAGDTSEIWSPAPLGPGGAQLAPYYWPKCVTARNTLPAYEDLYRKLRGYERCENGDLEVGLEKIAIYGDGLEVMHVARQTADGRWASKMGGLADIVHDRPEDVECDGFGAVQAFMSRPVSAALPAPEPLRLILPPSAG